VIVEGAAEVAGEVVVAYVYAEGEDEEALLVSGT